MRIADRLLASEPVNEPLGRRIKSDIEKKILSGAWPPGHRIPFEHELMVEYGCSRMTVNKVLSQLAAAGLLERRRRVGTFVSRPLVQSAVLEIPDIGAEITRRRQIYGYELMVLRRRKATKADVRFLVVEPGTDILFLTCRHLADGRPFAVEERRINLAAVPAAAHVDFSVEPPGSWLLGHVAWTQAEHRIVAINAGTEHGGSLGVTPDTACLAVERRTWREAASITHVRQVFPGDLYHLTANFTP